MIRPLFKAHEPFMEVPKGFGYLGVIQYDDIEDKVQCHICGKWFKCTGMHIAKKHKTSCVNYKIEFGLNLGTALCGTELSRKQSIQAKRNFKGERKRKMCLRGRTLFKNRRPPRVNGRFNIQVRNSKGLCDLQMKSRYEIVKRIVKREPSSHDLMRYDRRLLGVIVNRGTLNKFRQSIGVSPRKCYDWGLLPDLDYVVALRKKAKDKRRCPRPSDFHTGDKPSRSNFFKHFGSWHKALQVAGLK